MRRVISALVIAPLWLSPALAQDARQPVRTDRALTVEALELRLNRLETSLRQNPSEPSAEEEIQKLTERVSTLEQQLSALEAQTASRLQALEAATEELSDQLSPLLDAIEVSGNGVKIHAPGTLDLHGATVGISAAKVNVGAALVELHGILKSPTVVAETVSAGTYTPGAGNIW